MHKPTVGHFKIAFRLLRYLKGAPGKGILITKSDDLKLRAYSDSDWAKCLDTRKSITSFCVYLGNFLICWKSKKQTTVSRSSAEAKFRSMCAATRELMWLINLLKELDVEVLLPVDLYCDNSAALSIAENPVFHERTKHFEIDLFFIRDQITKGLIKTKSITSDNQPADILTKGLLPSDHIRLCNSLSLFDPFSV